MNSRFKNLFLIVLGSFITSLGINMFYIPNDMVSGGVSGIGIIVRYFSRVNLGYEIPLSITNLFFNVPLFIILYKKFGYKYIKRSIFASLLFSTFLQITEALPKYYGDYMLASVYGGILIGFGIGIIFNASATTGGTEAAAQLLHLFNDRLSISNYVFLIDTVIILIGMYAFGAEKAMYAVISLFITSKCIDIVASGSTLDKAAFIIARNSNLISKKVKENMERDIINLNNNKGEYISRNNYSESILCIFSQKELQQLKEIVKMSDENAFIILFDIKDVYGNGFKKL